MRSSPDEYPEFPRGVDYILSHIGLSRPSYMTRYHLVSEPSPCPDITAGLGAWLRIAQSFTLLPYLQYLSGASEHFHDHLGSKCFRGFPNSLEALRINELFVRIELLVFAT